MIFNENFARPRLFEGPFTTPASPLRSVTDMVSIFATSFYSMYVNLLLTVNPDIFNMKLNIFHGHNLKNNTYMLTASL